MTSLMRFLRVRVQALAIAGLMVLGQGALCMADDVVLGAPPLAPTPAEVLAMQEIEQQSALLGPVQPPPLTDFTVDIASRETVRGFFNTVYQASANFSIGWTGDHASCTAGDTDPEFRDLVALRLNYFRAMAGVPAVISLNDTYNFKAQQSALMMSKNNTLDHYPPPSWECYTADGAEAAGKSNIASGNAGPDAITAYINDHGGGNTVVGHRRWILYPQTQVMGTGDVPRTTSYVNANDNWVMDGRYGTARPAVRDRFVSWPPPGFVPYQVVFTRWSFSHPAGNFASATVTMTSGGTDIPVIKETVANGYGENTLVWYPASRNPASPAGWSKPAADTTYTVTISGVTISGLPSPITYDVTVFDPHVPGPDTVVPAVTGPAQPGVGQANAYAITTIPGATGYEWRRSQSVLFTAIDGANNGLANFDAYVSGGYNLVTNPPTGGVNLFFHLAHGSPEDQWLKFMPTLLARSNSAMQFRSRLSTATTNQVARVQVSTDQGGSWADVYTQVVTNTTGDNTFVARNVPLGVYAGRSFQVRFLYDYLGSGSRYVGTDPWVGWHFDDVGFTNTDTLTNAVSTVVAGPGFSFSPTQAGDYVLDARAQAFGGYGLEWSPVTRVTAAVISVPPTLQIATGPTRVGNAMEFEFTVTNPRPSPVYELWKTSALNGIWARDTGATLSVITAGSRYRFSTPIVPGPGGTFLQVRSN